MTLLAGVDGLTGRVRLFEVQSYARIEKTSRSEMGIAMTLRIDRKIIINNEI